MFARPVTKPLLSYYYILLVMRKRDTKLRSANGRAHALAILAKTSAQKKGRKEVYEEKKGMRNEILPLSLQARQMQTQNHRE